MFVLFVVTYRVTNFLLKLIDMLLFSMEKLNFHFFVVLYFQVLQSRIQGFGQGKRDLQNQRSHPEGSDSYPQRNCFKTLLKTRKHGKFEGSRASESLGHFNACVRT